MSNIYHFPTATEGGVSGLWADLQISEDQTVCVELKNIGSLSCKPETGVIVELVAGAISSIKGTCLISSGTESMTLHSITDYELKVYPLSKVKFKICIDGNEYESKTDEILKIIMEGSKNEI